VPEILGEMVESCAPSVAAHVRSVCHAPVDPELSGSLKIAGIQAPIRGLWSFVRTVCSIPSGKSQYVEGGVIFAAWWSRQCAFKLSIFSLDIFIDMQDFYFFGFESTQLARPFVSRKTFY